MISALYIPCTLLSLLISSIENVSKVFVNSAQSKYKDKCGKKDTFKYEVTFPTMSSMTTTK